MAIAVCDAGDTKSKKFMLSILGHNTRIARSEKLDAFTESVGIHQNIGDFFNGQHAGFIAVTQECGHCVVYNLDHHITCLVIGVNTSVNVGNTFAHAACQLEFEVAQSVIPHAATKSHHGGFTDM